MPIVRDRKSEVQDTTLIETKYLQDNPDVLDYYKDNTGTIGMTASEFAKQHYQTYGASEGRSWGQQQEATPEVDFTQRAQPDAPAAPTPTQTYGGWENIVRDQYRNTFGAVQPDAAGVQYWTDKLTSGIMDIAQVQQNIAAGAAPAWGQDNRMQPGYAPDPSPESAMEYLQSNPDVMNYFTQNSGDLGMTAVDYAKHHYATYGQGEGRAWGSTNTRLGEADGFYNPMQDFSKLMASLLRPPQAPNMPRTAPQQPAQLKAPIVDYARDETGKDRRMSAKSRFKNTLIPPASI